MFLKSLQWRLVSFFCLISICLMIPIGFFLNNKVDNWYYQSFKEGIDRGFEYWDIAKKSNPDSGEIDDELRQNKNGSLFNIIGINKSYTIFNTRTNEIYTSSDSRYDSNNKGEFYNELLESDNFVRAMSGKDGGEKKLERYGKKEFFDYAKPIGENVLYFRYYKDEWQQTIDDFNNIILSSLMIAVIFAFVLGYMLSKTITVPIVRIMHKAESIATGNFDQVLEVKSDDEIGKLTSTFNNMAKNLKDTLAEISSEKNKIETILNYMTDGVVAFNLKGEVIHINPAAKQIIGKENIDITFNEYVKKYDLGISIEEVLYLETLHSREVKIDVNDKTLRIYFAAFTDEAKKPEGIIAVLQDITEQQKLENMRREFVANVSHELRTPLTSIKSYAETLLDGAMEDRETTEKFLGVINSEADRMTRLVKDLLQLSRLDNRQMQWNIHEICFVELVKSCVDKMQMEAGNKQQALECFVIGEIPCIKADHDRIEQVVLNIISNAIKYTPDDGKITVYIGKTHSEVYMKVVDTGIGIPQKDLPRIFERFYRVDKARSREMGGTGLGLAIAREIVEAHSGFITISSEAGNGTEVVVKLPVDTGM